MSLNTLFADIKAAAKLLPAVSDPLPTLVVDCGDCGADIAASTVITEPVVEPIGTAIARMGYTPEYVPQTAEGRHEQALYEGIGRAYPERCPICWDGERNADPACDWAGYRTA